MNLNSFAKRVTEHEGLKKEVNIGQVKEVLAVVNKLTCGMLSFIVRVFIH